MSSLRHICGNGRTTIECPECVDMDRAARTSFQVLGVQQDEAWRMADECESPCDTLNWPTAFTRVDPTWLVASYCCRRCRGRWQCGWSVEYVFERITSTSPGRTKQPIPRSLAKQVMERDAYRCQWSGCGTWLDLQVDHVIPEALGGPTELDNLQTLCRPHNLAKGAKLL